MRKNFEVLVLVGVYLKIKSLGKFETAKEAVEFIFADTTEFFVAQNRDQNDRLQSYQVLFRQKLRYEFPRREHAEDWLEAYSRGENPKTELIGYQFIGKPERIEQKSAQMK